MHKKTINELNKIYDLEFDKVVSEIKKKKAKLVLLQFPDGLKMYATTIVNYFEENTKAEFLIWLGTCYGACDTPVGLDNLGIDLAIQFGHSAMMPIY